MKIDFKDVKRILILGGILLAINFLIYQSDKAQENFYSGDEIVAGTENFITGKIIEKTQLSTDRFFITLQKETGGREAYEVSFADYVSLVKGDTVEFYRAPEGRLLENIEIVETAY